MGWKLQKPVVEEKPPAHREGDVCEADVCRARHPAYGWGWFVVDDGPNFEKPARWVEENPEDPDHSGGWWVYAKDCD